jgi:hypothetical protein
VAHGAGRTLSTCAYSRALEPPLSSPLSLVVGTGYNCRRPLRSCTELPVLAGSIGTRGPPPAPAFLLLAVVGGGGVVGVGMDVGAQTRGYGDINTHTPPP